MSAAQQIKSHPVVIQAQDRFNTSMAQLDKELSKYPVLNQIEEKTQVPKAYGAIIVAFTFSLLLLVNSLAQPGSNLIGWASPAWLSYQALESPGHADDIQWLTYWVVFGFLNFTESFALRVILYYVPWYFAFKTAFVLWLQLPSTRGAQVMYGSVFRPLLANFRNQKTSAPTFAPTTTAQVYDHDKTS